MASTVRRNPNKNGLVLLGSDVSVAQDGFVTVTARWLAPSAGVSGDLLALDSGWPGDVPLPVGMPINQGGPYLVSRKINKANGLTTIDTVHVTAIAPVRLSVSVTSSRAAFSGYAESTNNNDEPISQSLSFDYDQISRTYSYATINAKERRVPPSSPGIIYNRRSEGASGLVKVRPAQTITGERTTVGPVHRISITSTTIYEQYSDNVGGIAVYDSSDTLMGDDSRNIYG